VSAGAESEPTRHIDRDHALALLEDMLRIRRFEEKCAELYQSGKIRGFLHLYIGEEAVAVGAMQAIGSDDSVVSTYRDHGHALARGIPAESLMAELYGKANGCSRGRGGSMHFFDAERRFYGGYAIVGGGLPIAAGLALADKMRGDARVTACFFGEGAAAEGEFHEALNLAALWRLPIVFLCENNRYAMGTALERSESETSIAEKARAYLLPADSVDGMDVLAVEAATQRAVGYVRAGNGPYFVEFNTYRFRGHSMADPELYREKAEVDEWKHRDPIALFGARMRELGLLADDDIARLEQSVAQFVYGAVAAAEAGPWEPVEDVLKYVTSDSP
jgi:pyruvate dehydrogenase E1 component alpha subunit